MTTRRFLSGKTFKTFKREVIARIQNRNEINLEQEDETSRLIISALSFTVENISYFIDNAINEAFFRTARFPNSVDDLASVWSYPEGGAVSASGQIRLRPSEAPPGEVVLDPGFVFNADNGFQYRTTEQVRWQQGERDFKSVTISEGELRTTTFRGNGELSQRKRLTTIEDDEFVQYKSADVLVENDEYTEVDVFEEDGENVFRVSYIADPPYIEFGDGITGNVPGDGVEISLEYVANHGSAGNIGKPGKITGAADTVTVQGQNVDFEIDDQSGIMTGGSDTESLDSIKANAPAFKHADKAVVSEPDFEALSDSFQDPVFGTVAQSKAFRVDEFEKDLESVSKTRDLERVLSDLIDELSNTVTNLNDIRDLVTDPGFVDEILAQDGTFSQSDVDGNYDNLLSFFESGGAIDQFFSTVSDKIASFRRQKVKAQTALTELDLIPQDIQDQADEVRSEATDIANILNQIAIDPSTESTLQNKIDTIQAKASDIKASSSSLLIGKKTQNISSALDTMETLIEDIQNEQSSLEGQTDTFIEYLETLKADLEEFFVKNLKEQTATAVENQGGTIVRSKEDAEESLDKLDGLKEHLEEIYESECGPNLISVPILTYDEDDFYAQPSLGLQDAVEDYLSSRDEPSVIIRVNDGSKHLVRPVIDVYFKPNTGYTPTNVRDRIESEILERIKDSAFGGNLYLGGSQGVHSFGDEIEGVDFINFEIQGHLPAQPPEHVSFPNSEVSPRPNVEIDGQGNLLIPDKNVLTRPVNPLNGNSLLRFFVKKSPTAEPQKL